MPNTAYKRTGYYSDGSVELTHDEMQAVLRDLSPAVTRKSLSPKHLKQAAHLYGYEYF